MSKIEFDVMEIKLTMKDINQKILNAPYLMHIIHINCLHRRSKLPS